MVNYFLVVNKQSNHVMKVNVTETCIKKKIQRIVQTKKPVLTKQTVNEIATTLH